MIIFPAKFNKIPAYAGFTVLNPLSVPETRTETPPLQPAIKEVFNLPKGPQVIKIPNTKFDFKNWHLISPRLKERERRILEARFGIRQKQISSLQELGDELNISKERVRQIQTGALQKCVKFSEELKTRKDNHGKIDPEVLTTAIVEGISRKNAIVLAGSNASTPESLSTSAQSVLNRPAVKAMLLQKFEEKKEQILEALTKEKAGEASYLQLITSLGILVDKEQLLRNEPTAIISQMPRMVIDGDRVKFEVPINNPSYGE